MFFSEKFRKPKMTFKRDIQKDIVADIGERHLLLTNEAPEGFPCFLCLSVEVRTLPNKSELWRRDIKNTYPSINE